MPRAVYEAAKDADAVLILTDWKEFAGLDLVRLNQAVRFPIVIDGRNLYDPREDVRARLHLCERWPAGNLPGATGQAAQTDLVIARYLPGCRAFPDDTARESP